MAAAPAVVQLASGKLRYILRAARIMAAGEVNCYSGLGESILVISATACSFSGLCSAVDLEIKA